MGLASASRTALAHFSMSSTFEYRPPASSKNVSLKKYVWLTGRGAALQREM